METAIHSFSSLFGRRLRAQNGREKVEQKDKKFDQQCPY